MNTTDPPIGFAVIGYGRIGSRHAAIIRDLPGAKLQALADINGAGGYTGDEPFFDSLDALLLSPEGQAADVLTIATPNGCHADQACVALRAGKHVVIEKPMALTTLDARRIMENAQRADKRVFVVMQNRYAPPSKWLKQLVASGKLGRLFMVQLDCYWNRDERYYGGQGWHGTKALDGGTLFTQFSHFVDMLVWLFGDITRIQTRLRDFAHNDLTEFEDSGFVSFDFESGGMGSLNFSTAVWGKNMESSLTIVAENGSVRIGGQYMERVTYCHVKDYTLPDALAAPASRTFGADSPADASPAADPAMNHRYFMQDVVDILKGRTDKDLNAADGLKVVDIIERIYHSQFI